MQNKKLKIIFQMDDFNKINPANDSTLLLANAAQKLGHQIFFATAEDLFAENAQILIKNAELKLNLEQEKFYSLGVETINKISDFDFFFIRQDPPVDLDYLTNSYLLEQAASQTKIINEPISIIKFPEKINPLNYQEYAPQTIIAADAEIFREFLAKQKIAILKPLYACGGAGVKLLQSPQDQENLIETIHEQQSKFGKYLIMQEYLPEIKKGDLRILIGVGEILGSFLRVPAEGKVAANLHAGGSAVPAQLSALQKDIAAKVGADLLQNKIYLAGLDFIGDKLTEINITSPMGFAEINKLYQTNSAEKFWDLLLKESL